MVSVLMLLAVAPVNTPTEPAPAPRRIDVPVVRFVSASETTTGSMRLTFEVTNGDEPVRFFGYSADSYNPSSEDRIEPVWDAGGRRTGEWVYLASKSTSCANGLGWIDLPAKARVTFDIELRDEPWDEATVGVMVFLGDKHAARPMAQFTRRQVENAILARKTASAQGRRERDRESHAPDR
jgi:hypothetical protein